MSTDSCLNSIKTTAPISVRFDNGEDEEVYCFSMTLDYGVCGALQFRSNSEKLLDQIRNAFHVYPEAVLPSSGEPVPFLELFLGDTDRWPALPPTSLPWSSVKTGAPGFGIADMDRTTDRGLDYFKRKSDLFLVVPKSMSRPIQLFMTKESEGDPTQRLRIKSTESPPVVENNVLDLIKVLVVRALQHFCIHAASVATPDGLAILLVAPSGVGKSTTALALHREGFELLSDEMTLVTSKRNSETEVSGLFLPPMISGNIKKLADLASPFSTAPPCTKEPFPLDEIGRLPSPGQAHSPKAIFFLERPSEQTEEFSAVPMTSLDAFPMVMSQILDINCSQRTSQRMETIFNLVNSVSLFTLSLGTRLETAAPCILRCLKGKPS